MWFRSGGDRGNRSVMPVVGPTLTRIAHVIPLAVPPHPENAFRRIAGGAVASDGSLRLVVRGRLIAIDADTRDVRWSCELSEHVIYEPADPEELEGPEETEADYDEGPELVVVPAYSMPTILDDDRTLVILPGTAAIFDRDGVLVDSIRLPGADDSGPAPNLDLRGRPILTTMYGDVYVWESDGLRKVGKSFGYDIVPVAVFADGTFAVSGYAGSGFCRVTADGTRVWRSDLKDPDLLPTVNRAQQSAVGSLNGKCSSIFEPDGRRIASYPEAAVFAEYEADGGWIALSKHSLARLSPTGVVQWRREVACTNRWGANQPLVDANGTIFIVAGHTIHAFDGAGTELATLALGGSAMPLIPVRAGVLATIVDETLVLVE